MGTLFWIIVWGDKYCVNYIISSSLVTWKYTLSLFHIYFISWSARLEWKGTVQKITQALDFIYRSNWQKKKKKQVYICFLDTEYITQTNGHLKCNLGIIFYGHQWCQIKTGIIHSMQRSEVFKKAQYVKCSISLEKLGIDCMPQWVEKSTKIHTTHWSKYCFLTLLRM